MCECGHPQSQHKLGKGGCRNPDCWCARFEVAPVSLGGVTAAEAAEALKVNLPKLAATGASFAAGGIIRQPVMPGGESTSAELRRVEAERDEALAVQKDAVEAFIRITDRCTLLQAELASARTELEAVRNARDNLDRELNELCERLAAPPHPGTPALASWVVARDGGRDCLRCDQEIRRGEAYEYMPTTDELQHIHCPDKQGAPTA